MYFTEYLIFDNEILLIVISINVLKFKKNCSKICETEKLHIHLQPKGFIIAKQ